MENHRLNVWIMLGLLCVASCGGDQDGMGNGQAKDGEENQEVACAGTTYSTCICPGNKVCPVNDGEYDFVDVECEEPIEITAQNIDNIVGSLRLKDPPCADKDNCKRVSIFDRSSTPANRPECRCREKTSVCVAKP
ncbi:MAG TPA: hypothetical protein VGL10_01525 [Gammaproteobacteria bacterium]